MTKQTYRVLVLLAHPSFHHSRINKTLKESIENLPGVTVHDLYDAYPEFYIDVMHEQQLLKQSDFVIFQHPLYWYSTTPMLKLWQDVVLSRGFAYGSGGTVLNEKDFMQIISTGGKEEAFQATGYNEFTIDQLLTPTKAMAKMCGMAFRDPLVIHHSYEITDQELALRANHYNEMLSSYLAKGSQIFQKEGA